MKTKDYLKYLEYPLIQDEKMFRYNTDTVVLGTFLDSLKGRSVLDIGTNNGALLLYAYDKGAKEFHGVDIFKEAIEIAEENIKRHTDNYHFYHCKVQDLKDVKVDTVICNPPYFEMNNVTDDKYYRAAMFEESLPIDDLFKAFRDHMKDNGEVYMLYQADRFPEVYNMCLKYKLKIMKIQFVHDIHSKYALRVLLKLKIGPMTKLRVSKPMMIDNGELL